jgi:hypothetical protein
MVDFLKMAVDKIPLHIQKEIVEQNLISRAVNITEPGTPMERLFDIYEEYIDASGEFDDWTCYTCRQSILTYFHRFKPYLCQTS